jgi:hypothetical protein
MEIRRSCRFFEDYRRTEATELNAHPYRTNILCTWFFLAMAHHRLVRKIPTSVGFSSLKERIDK